MTKSVVAMMVMIAITGFVVGGACAFFAAGGRCYAPAKADTSMSGMSMLMPDNPNGCEKSVLPKCPAPEQPCEKREKIVERHYYTCVPQQSPRPRRQYCLDWLNPLNWLDLRVGFWGNSSPAPRYYGSDYGYGNYGGYGGGQSYGSNYGQRWTPRGDGTYTVTHGQVR